MGKDANRIFTSVSISKAEARQISADTVVSKEEYKETSASGDQVVVMTNLD